MALLSDGFCSRHSYEPKKWKDIKNGFTHFANNDIVIAKITPCFQNRKSAVVTGLPNGFGAGTTELHVLRDNTKELFMPYFLLICKTQAFIQDGVKNFSGTAGQQRIGKDFISKYLIPVPPVSEQERIVQRLHLLEPLLISYENAYDSIVNQQKNFPAQLKRSILQYAVQGKLVSQDPADEPAAILLEHIRAEKEHLIKAGKIKRDKHESVIFKRNNSYYEKVDGIERCIDDELPFEIPDSWEWTTIGTTCINIQYGSSRKSESTGTMAVLRMGNIQNGRIDTQKLVYTSDKEEIAHYPLEYNDLLFNRTNSKELVGKTAIYKSEVPAIYAGYLIRITPLIDSDYLNYVMQTQFYWVYCQNVRSDAIGQSNINAEKLKNFIYPLPPLHEQKRIAKKLNSIFTKIK